MDNYIPPQMIDDCMVRMFDMLMTMLQNPIGDDLKIPIVDQIFNYISGDASDNLTRNWLEKKYIHTVVAPDTSIFALSHSHQCHICLSLFKSKKISLDDKM